MLTNNKIEVPFDIFIDACAIYPPLLKEKEAIAEILELEHEHKVHLVLTKENMEELRKMNDPRIGNFLSGRTFWKRVVPDVSISRQIKRIIFPNKNLELNEGKDIESLATALHYHCKYYITMDKKHIWNNRDMIKSKFNIEVCLPSEFLSYAKKRLNWLVNHQSKMCELRKQSLITSWFVLLFLIISTLSCLAEPIVIKNVSIMSKVFNFEEKNYAVSGDFNSENAVTIKHDFDGDGKIEMLLGFQARTNDKVGVPVSFMILGVEKNAEFKPLDIISGNDYYNKLELSDIDSDGLLEILFWSNGGAHHTDLAIYKISKNKPNKIFEIGSACGIKANLKSNPPNIEVGIPKFNKPGWSYADEPTWEIWIWNGKTFAKKTTFIN